MYNYYYFHSFPVESPRNIFFHEIGFAEVIPQAINFDKPVYTSERKAQWSDSVMSNFSP